MTKLPDVSGLPAARSDNVQEREAYVVGNAPRITPLEKTAVEELLTDAMITDATWATLAKTLDQPQLFELTLVVGQFTAVAFFQNSLRIPLKADNAGLAAR